MLLKLFIKDWCCSLTTDSFYEQLRIICDRLKSRSILSSNFFIYAFVVIIIKIKNKRNLWKCIHTYSQILVVKPAVQHIALFLKGVEHKHCRCDTEKCRRPVPKEFLKIFY